MYVDWSLSFEYMCGLFTIPLSACEWAIYCSMWPLCCLVGACLRLARSLSCRCAPLAFY